MYGIAKYNVLKPAVIKDLTVYLFVCALARKANPKCFTHQKVNSHLIFNER